MSATSQVKIDRSEYVTKALAKAQARRLALEGLAPNLANLRKLHAKIERKEPKVLLRDATLAFTNPLTCKVWALEALRDVALIQPEQFREALVTQVDWMIDRLEDLKPSARRSFQAQLFKEEGNFLTHIATYATKMH